jgi:hypothetical protein
MTHHHEIQIDVDSDGNVTFTVQGVQGKGCQGLARALAEALGGEVADHGHTADYARTPQVAGRTHQPTQRR